MKKNVNIVSAVLISIIIISGCNHMDSPKAPKVKDITVVSKTDSISYVLGIVWATQMARAGFDKKITFAFYSGVKDYLRGDSSLMGIYMANSYIAERNDRFMSTSFEVKNDENIKIDEIELNSEVDSFSYAVGYAWGRGAYGIGISEITPALLLGINKSFKRDSVEYTYITGNAYLMAYIEEIRAKKFADIKLANEQWLQNNKQNKEVFVLPSGVQYKIVKSGKGKKPGTNDIIECNMISKLINGSVYENSYDTGKPFKFFITALPKGLVEAVQLMNEGDKWEIYLPYNLAYGSGGVKDVVPPFATMIFEFELVKVTKN